MGGELAAKIAEPHSPAPVVVHRDYGLPAWARGSETFVIAISHSGETEETLSAFQQAVENGCPVWMYVHEGQPRTALGFLFRLALAAFPRLNLLPYPSADLAEPLHA